MPEIKAYGAWIGPDRRMRIKRAKITSEGIASLKGGPSGMKVSPHRTFLYRGKPCFLVNQSQGECVDVFESDGEGGITSYEFDEVANNSYAKQVMDRMGRQTSQEIIAWATLIAAGLAVMILAWLAFRTKTGFDTVSLQLQGISNHLQGLGNSTTLFNPQGRAGA